MLITVGDLLKHIRKLTNLRASHPKTGNIIKLLDSIPIDSETIRRPVELKAHKQMPIEYPTVSNILNYLKNALKTSSMIVIDSQPIDYSSKTESQYTLASQSSHKHIVKTKYESDSLKEFDSQFRKWVKEACADWHYDFHQKKWFDNVNVRLPKGLRSLLGLGLQKGLIISQGRFFNLKNLPLNKGPYNWFSQNPGQNTPNLNGEYFVHVAEYIRLCSITSGSDLSVKFEDDTMDIAVYSGQDLFVYYEIKQYISQIEELITVIRNYQSNVNLMAPDRGNDPLRKAKCIIRNKPSFFVGVAIGGRYEYRVDYHGDTSFVLYRDAVPIL